MSKISTILIGNESLLIGCAGHLLDQGHDIRAVITRNADIREWATMRDLPVLTEIADLPEFAADMAFDWLLSIANLDLIPDDVLALPERGAVNFHDGPLPRYAGLNTPAWAILNGEARHGITWHLIENGIDTGDILQQRLFDIAPDETAFSLNSKCYAAAMDSFPSLLAQLASGDLTPVPQDAGARSYFARDDRPDAAGLLDFTRPARELAAQVRALDFGGYRNPMLHAKIWTGGQLLCVGHARVEPTGNTAAPGTVLDVTANGAQLATAQGVLALGDVSTLAGTRIDLASLMSVGDVATLPDTAALTGAARRAARAEPHWHAALAAMAPAELPLARLPRKQVADWRHRALPLARPLDLPHAAALALGFAAQACGAGESSIAFGNATLSKACSDALGVLADWVPLTLDDTQASLEAICAEMERTLRKLAAEGGFAADLPRRMPELRGLAMPQIAVTHGIDTPMAGSVLTLELTDAALVLHHDAARLDDAAMDLLTARLEKTLAEAAKAGAASRPLADLTPLPETERALVVTDANLSAKPYDVDHTIHRAFEAQVARTPDATALVFEDETLSYSALNARANGLAKALQRAGVETGTHVGLCVARGPDLLIGALAILKAGGAYVPLDPAYPADRLAHYLTDSGAPVIVSQTAQLGLLPETDAVIVNMADHRDAIRGENLDVPIAGRDAAYLIYTSGSTGLPKGVTVEHRNVANFFTGMDDVIETHENGVWQAVTSLAFDISVLELFYTLARGFKLVLCSDEGRLAVSNGPISGSAQPVDFSLYYWSNDCEAGPNKYELLLEGAKFADTNGFDALWTPERHFHAFGGPYPNPAVTGAAVAAITKNLAVRAGSCVAPLHHPARIAEEWAVIDNLTNGRAGLAMASGWHPDDFVLRPENTPPDNKAGMMECIDQVRALWRGEAVEFPTKSGEPHAVITQPRPVSKELPIWVTTAGNPATWQEAGSIGANILTHLLGQSVEEVGEKITLYHEALREAGHDPADFTVTVMLHTLIGEDRDEVADLVRGPLKDYLRSAAGLIKQYAWAFPAFKKPEGVTNPFQMDLGTLEDDELEAILDFAFERYFNDAGLFGTVEDGLARVDELKAIGVGEVACLIDYGVNTADVMASLPLLAKLRARANETAEPAEDDHSLAAQIIRHKVTHMQSTPSMARMLVMNDEARMALGRLRHLYLGGEALPGALVGELRKCTRARITNMYGPTETTIWSATARVVTNDAEHATVALGKPIANSMLYVLDEAGQPVPVGVAGELYIGGDGVARGYWQRDDINAERFVEDPFAHAPDARMYRTGDLARRMADGRLEFLGRADHQLKIRGQRIELGEIEACLAAHPDIREAVVVPCDGADGTPQLAAYVTAGAAPDIGVLRRHLLTRLPEVMVPQHMMALDSFPLTPNRKIDRNALPEPAVQVAEAPTRPAAAGSRQAAIAAIWSRILGVGNIGAGDSFFDLGGHSLLAVQAHREIRRELDVPQLSIADIFRFPRLGALAAHLDGLAGGGEQATPDPAPGTDPATRTEMMSKRRAMRAARTRRAG